ncbi:MAG: hypothetical protein K2X47_19885 [Bdellovibrionales bacterium]|nr:hypothetical protein [Bdellovibrionales bacterium]
MKNGLLKVFVGLAVTAVSSVGFSAALQPLAPVVAQISAQTQSLIVKGILEKINNGGNANVDASEALAGVQREIRDLAAPKINGRALSALQASVVADLGAAGIVVMAQGGMQASFDLSKVVLEMAETSSTEDDSAMITAWNNSAKAIKKYSILSGGKASPEKAAIAKREIVQSAFEGVFTEQEKRRCGGDNSCLSLANGKAKDRAKQMLEKECT